MKVCAASGCERRARTRGWCDGHYKRYLEGRPVDSPLARRVKGGARCEAASCDRRAETQGLCLQHFRRLRCSKHCSGQRVEDLVEHALEILERYAPERLAP